MPLIFNEITDFDLLRYLQYGGLPMVYLSNEPAEDLDAYVYTYLEQEIKAEAVVQKLPAFSRFLQLSALTSGNILNFSSIASDASDRRTKAQKILYGKPRPNCSAIWGNHCIAMATFLDGIMEWQCCIALDRAVNLVKR